VASTTTTLVMLVGYSAMAGLIGGGGLGRLAYNYGYQRFDTAVMIATIVIMVILVQLIQWIGDRIVRAVDHR
jgi:D-methionine transport system permease protein